MMDTNVSCIFQMGNSRFIRNYIFFCPALLSHSHSHHHQPNPAAAPLCPLSLHSFYALTQHFTLRRANFILFYVLKRMIKRTFSDGNSEINTLAEQTPSDGIHHELLFSRPRHSVHGSTSTLHTLEIKMEALIT